MIDVYAASIDNLTVARYFAAMEVAYMGYTVTSDNLSSVIDMIAWIQGPKIVLEVNDAAARAAAIASGIGDYIYDTSQDEWYTISGLEADQPCIHFINHSSQLDTLRFDLSKPQFIDIQSVDVSLLEKLKAGNLGLVLRGGIEESIGIKSFDELDEVFSLLESH